MVRKGCFVITSLVENIVQYGVFGVLVLLSTWVMYRGLTTKEQRDSYKVKLSRGFEEKTKELVERGMVTELQSQLEELEVKNLNAFVFNLIRYVFIIIVFIAYIILPYIRGEMEAVAVIIVALVYLFTEPKFKYSLTTFILKSLIFRKKRNKVKEVFTLFDILKAQLINMNEGQDINVYNLVSDAMPTFNHIQGTLAKFLSLWKRSPELAKDVFEDEIGGESAKVLGMILYKLDTVSKEDGLKLITDESGVFSFNYFQKELQKTSGFTNLYFGFFMFVNILLIVWLIYFVYIMFDERMGSTNMGF